MKNTSFKKLGSKKGIFIESTALYAMEDHLLLEKKILFLAYYRRFFYEDITSILIFKRPEWKIKILLFTLTSIALAMFSAYSISRINMLFKGSVFSTLYFFIINAPMWLVLLTELALGSTSMAIISTTISSEKAILADRYKKSKRILAEVAAIIESKQGPLNTITLNGSIRQNNINPLISKKGHYNIISDDNE